MRFSDDEKKKLQAMLKYLIDKKHKESGGHCGFHPVELKPVLNDMVDKGLIERRRTINSTMYFKSKQDELRD